MKGVYVNETCNASLKQFAITLEALDASYAIMLVVNTEKEPVDPTIMQLSLAYISMKYSLYRRFGGTAVSVLVQSRRNLSSTSRAMYARKFRKKMTRNVQKSFR